ncbi:MAG TPA: serine hydrolase domain-containing protein, partial [Clostridia bacterium]|nr:serine hydrolase domain-containing protein [Clostridia bacterium]
MKRIIASALMGAMLLTGIQSAKAQDNDEKIDNIVMSVLNEAKVPGVSVSVVSGDQILFEKGYGVESLESQKPMTPNSLSAIGSVTKSFTTLAILQQVEQGKINLDDPVIKYIPEFKTLDEDRSKNITVRMLLNNSSGLPHSIDFNTFSKSNESTDYMEAIKKNRTIKLLFDPGTAYAYSNEGFVIAGRILEIVTGMAYTEYIEQNILKPLTMEKTTTDIEKIKQEDVLYGHLGGVDSFIPAEKSYSGQMLPAGSETRSSAHEMAHYMQMLINKGKYQNQQMISSDLFEQTINTGVVPFSLYGQEMKYGYGWMHNASAGLLLHGGNTLSMSSMVILDTQKKIGVTVLYNVTSVNPAADKSIGKTALDILSVFTGRSYPQMKEDRIKREQQKDFDTKLYGKYISEDGYTHLSIEKGSKPLVRTNGNVGEMELELTQYSDTRLLAENISAESLISVERGNDGNVISITEGIGGKFYPEKELSLTGYTNKKWKDLSFICPETIELTQQERSCRFTNGNVQLDMVKLEPKEEFYKAVNGSVKETDVRECYLGGKKVFEKIYIEDRSGKPIA